MPRRCIMLLPEFENMDAINRIRSEYDPLCTVIQPHITLVFPFESDITASALTAHIQAAAKGFAPFNISLSGFTASLEAEANYLFLHLTSGADTVRALSGALYTGILAPYQAPFYRERYCPHITVGVLDKTEDHAAILQNISAKAGDAVFNTRIQSICVKTLGENNSSATTELTVGL